MNPSTRPDVEQPEIAMSIDELLRLHPLPWSHHLLLIKDAKGRQVIHIGGLYNELSKMYEGRYLSGLNALFVELVNARVSPVPAEDGAGDSCQRCGLTGGKVVSFIYKSTTMSRWVCPHCLDRVTTRADSGAPDLAAVVCEACEQGYRLAKDGLHYDDERGGATWGVCRKVTARAAATPATGDAARKAAEDIVAYANKEAGKHAPWYGFEDVKPIAEIISRHFATDAVAQARRCEVCSLLESSPSHDAGICNCARRGQCHCRFRADSEKEKDGQGT